MKQSRQGEKGSGCADRDGQKAKAPQLCVVLDESDGDGTSTTGLLHVSTNPKHDGWRPTATRQAAHADLKTQERAGNKAASATHIKKC
jgi:hypothetical protein